MFFCFFFKVFLVQVQPNESWLPLPTKEFGFPFSAQTVPDVSAQWPALSCAGSELVSGFIAGTDKSLGFIAGTGRLLDKVNF